MGDAPTPEQSFAESFGALKSGAQSEAAALAARPPKPKAPDGNTGTPVATKTPETTTGDKPLGALGDEAIERRRAGGQKGSLAIPGDGESGPHGPIFRDYAGKWREARDRLLAGRTGEAVGALVHPDLPPADLIWGEEGETAGKGFGLAKIQKWHREVIDDLGDIYSSLPVVERNANTIQLDDGRYHATIRRNWKGSPKTWLLTAFEKKTGSK